MTQPRIPLPPLIVGGASYPVTYDPASEEFDAELPGGATASAVSVRQLREQLALRWALDVPQLSAIILAAYAPGGPARPARVAVLSRADDKGEVAYHYTDRRDPDGGRPAWSPVPDVRLAARADVMLPVVGTRRSRGLHRSLHALVADTPENWTAAEALFARWDRNAARLLGRRARPGAAGRGLAPPARPDRDPDSRPPRPDAGRLLLPRLRGRSSTQRADGMRHLPPHP